MLETNVFEDRFARDFTSMADFMQFLSERRANSRWMTAPSRELTFQPVEQGTPMGDLLYQLYDARGEGALMMDTMQNTSLLMKVNGEDYPVRACALKTILERARISGHALSKVRTEVLSQILNYCMNVASGQSLVRIADEKISAVHGGDASDYAVLEMLPLFQEVTDFLNREFPGNHFLTAHYDHTMAMAIWSLDGQGRDLLRTYRQELAARNLSGTAMVPALRFQTSDVGMSGANLYPVLLMGGAQRIVPLGNAIKTEHKHGADLDYFHEQLGLLYSRFREALDKQTRLMDVEIRYPANALLGVLKRIGAPKKISFEVQDEFLAAHGDQPCTAYELFLYVSEVIFYAQCSGANAARIAQLEEITARALNLRWEDYDRPGLVQWS